MSNYYYGASDLTSGYYISHHGILGQKWGIRRFQNKDGSLTPAGVKRYYDSYGNLTKKGKKEYGKQDASNAEFKRKIGSLPKDQVSTEDVAAIAKREFGTNKKWFQTSLKNKNGESFDMSLNKNVTYDPEMYINDMREIGDSFRNIENKALQSFIKEQPTFWDGEQERRVSKEDINDFKENSSMHLEPYGESGDEYVARLSSDSVNTEFASNLTIIKKLRLEVDKNGKKKVVVSDETWYDD